MGAIAGATGPEQGVLLLLQTETAIPERIRPRRVGASHFAELWYMFDHLDQDAWHWSAADRKLARRMAGYWTNFAKRGDPNGDGLPLWPHFDGAETILHLSDPVVVDGLPNRKSLQVFDAVYGSIPPLARFKGAGLARRGGRRRARGHGDGGCPRRVADGPALMRSLISFAAVALRCASERTSRATTAKPGPARRRVPPRRRR